jgi:hypothetical protein
VRTGGLYRDFSSVGIPFPVPPSATVSTTFGSHTLVYGFQSEAAPNCRCQADNDPDSEVAQGGITSGNRLGSIIFIEDNRDQDAELQYAVPTPPRMIAQEIGHQFSLDDAGSGLMSSDFYNNPAVRFRNADIAALRRRIHSPGRTN